MDRPVVKPPFCYYGGKMSMGPMIANALPPHGHYVEPFAGSLAVLLAKHTSSFETVNDLDGDLVTFWRVLRDQPKELARLAMLTPHSREEFAVSNDLDAAPTDLERARLVWVRLTQSRSLSMKPGGWKFAKEGSATHLSYGDQLATYAARMESVAARLHHVAIECRDALEVIEDYGQSESVCIYADPPYLGSLRKDNYRVELLDIDGHTQLADALKACKASVVLSGYDSPLYQDLFDGWFHKEVQAPPTISNATDRVEVLWSNRPFDEGLFDLL